ncbi:MAG: phosphoglucosamine mutase [Proteobacteria bacterium]|nr:phosphoglucosamine mutase [Desulfobacula sp.]MBU3952156.1 phosphoglucosamine mutase [Pseudomonadota bacterium]MBU4132147.1 phosphoglucosamine mutase [Pseudomonadota bacterium]
MGTLFGTDGIRGRANLHPITCEVALKTGRAVGLLTVETGYGAVVIGKDPRISGDMLESALAAGIASVGVDALLAGVIPTPGVAYLSSLLDGVGAGIVISASHNPYYDNGIKIFSRGGIKLSDTQEEAIESYIMGAEIVPRGNVGKISMISDGLELYSSFLLGKFPFKKLDSKLKIVIDASNGAASRICTMVFNHLLFDVQFIHVTPNGININDNCGSQHTLELKNRVLKEKADIGLAFDGDADRLIAIDERGNQITGDRLLAICAKFAKEKNRLKSNILVTTTMSNIGLSRALESLGIVHLKSDVGDRKVLEEMGRSGATMGGEDSGHMIFLEDHTTGDGMLSALKLLEVMVETGKSLSDLASIMVVYPQILMNVEVDASRPDFTKIAPIVHTIRRIEEQLADKGRVLIRYSGTQPLLRVMVEGPDKDLTREYCQEICRVIKENIVPE